MTQIRTKAIVGITALAAFGFLVAGATTSGCGSDDGGGGSGGAMGGGGTTGNAGATGNGGASECAPAAAALITDFGGGTTAQVGSPYFGADTGLTNPSVSATGGSLVITIDSGMPSTMYPYLYVGLPFNACTSAAAYTGVKFKASGTLTTGCSIQFSIVDKHHSVPANMGTCTADACYPSAKIFPLPATPTDVTVLFSEQTGGGANPGAPTADPSQILNIQWQVNPSATAACSGTVTIDDVTFI